MRFFVGLAAAIWSLEQLGVVGIIAFGILAVLVLSTVIMFWPIILVAGIILLAWLAARHLLGRETHGSERR